MNRILIILSAGLLVLLLISAANLNAQNYPGRSQEDHNAFEDFANMDKKIDAFIASNQKTTQAILQKLDLVLSNQQKILQELDIVKIRASRSR
ncbi:MAG: hypothetical protein ABIG46_01735 [Candidatus Omnitrophota bacterium]|nr:hypothetical protein [Candidatus Omnitrophota bacterium]